MSGFDDYIPGSWSWVADNGLVYWVAARNERGETIVEIFWHGLEREEAVQRASLTLPETLTSLHGFDVDDGYFVLETELQDGNEFKLILFDLSTRAPDLLDLGFVLHDVAIIHRGE